MVRPLRHTSDIAAAGITVALDGTHCREGKLSKKDATSTHYSFKLRTGAMNTQVINIYLFPELLASFASSVRLTMRSTHERVIGSGARQVGQLGQMLILFKCELIGTHFRLFWIPMVVTWSLLMG